MFERQYVLYLKDCKQIAENMINKFLEIEKKIYRISNAFWLYHQLVKNARFLN